MLNLLLFDSESKDFNLTALKKYVDEQSPHNPYFQNFLTFIEQQKPDQANNGDIVMRSLFNTVVADLNTSDSPITVVYLKNTNEVNPGFINMIRVFQKIFGLQVPDVPEGTFLAKRNWVEDSLRTLFTALNPHRTYTFDLSQLKQTDAEISGYLPITVRNPKTHEAFFSFTYYSQGGSHSAINDLKVLKQSAVHDYNEDLQMHETHIHPSTAEESIWLLTPQRMHAARLTHPIFTLFNRTIADNDSRIEVLQMIGEHYKQWQAEGSSFKPHLPIIKKMIGHLLEDMSWDDPEVLRKLSPCVLALGQQEDLRALLVAGVKGLTLTDSNLDALDDLLRNYPHLEHMTLSFLKKLEEFSAKNLRNLRTLDLSHSGPKKIGGLEDLSSLESLNLKHTEQLEELALKSLQKLKTLNLRGSGIKKIDGVEDLPSLEFLLLDQTNNLQTVSLRNLQKLKLVDLLLSAVKTLFLENLDGIEHLGLNDLPMLEKVVFKGSFKSLKTLSFERSNMLKEIDGLEYLEGLKTINIKRSIHRTAVKGLGLSTRVIDDEEPKK